MNSAAKFRSVVKGENFMTPNVIRFGETHGGHVFELSRGTGINGDTLYGVSVVNWPDRKQDSNLSTVFYSQEMAEAYIKDLS